MVTDARIEVLVEVPMGSRNKYEYDKDRGVFVLDRMLFSAVRYPGDYGYLPETLARDGDALDALVILGEPTFPGCVIPARVVGMLDMTDDKGPDEKILCVPDSDPRWQHVQELENVPKHMLDEISHFFGIYKDLEQKKVEVHGWRDRAKAFEVVASSRERYEG
ncbi:MAG: inorganic diphosphatase [Actinobacteria bacterium]|nr:inorganic diphosphatase [Actinomycetota bacterium]